MDFNTAFNILVDPEHEGTYSNNPADPGGETMWGITKRVAVAEGYAEDMKNLPLSFAQGIAKKRYWLPLRCDELPDVVRYEVFDFGYNAGVGNAALALQRSVRVYPDGVMGPDTLKAIGAMEPLMLYGRFTSEVLKHYTSLPTWATFGRGWARRVAANVKLLGVVS